MYGTFGRYSAEVGRERICDLLSSNIRVSWVNLHSENYWTCGTSRVFLHDQSRIWSNHVAALGHSGSTPDFHGAGSFLSSSLPGHMTFFCKKALTHSTLITSHAITNRTVMTEDTNLIDRLSIASPIWIVASVKPPFGNMKAHQDRENSIREMPLMIPHHAIAKNQNVRSHKKMPAVIPKIRRTSPTGKAVPNVPGGRTDWACTPSATKAAELTRNMLDNGHFTGRWRTHV